MMYGCIYIHLFILSIACKPLTAGTPQHVLLNSSSMPKLGPTTKRAMTCQNGAERQGRGANFYVTM